MFAHVRVGLLAALVTLASIALSSIPASAADKAFQRADLDEAAIKLEAQIKTDAGTGRQAAGATAPRGRRRLPEERRPQRHGAARPDHRAGAGRKRELAAPRARHPCRSASSIDRERAALLERAGTAAYIAYQRASNRNEEADALVIVGRSFADRQVWRPALDALRLSLELREVADVRALYEKMREDHGFRLLDYSVDADSASPRACFQFSEALPGKRTDFSPFVAVAGQRQAGALGRRQAALRRRAQARRALQRDVARRACRRPSRRRCRSRPTSRSMCATASRSCASPARPMCCRAPASAAFRWSASTPRRSTSTIYRIGDRNLIDTVLGRDFQRNLDRYDIERLTESRGVKVWNGELAVEQTLNAEITTAFPVDQAVGDMAPGVYVMTAEAKGTTPPTTTTRCRRNGSSSPTSGSRPIPATTASTCSSIRSPRTEPKAPGRGAADVARQRSAGDQAAPTPPAASQFEAGLARGEGALAPAMLVATDAKGDYAFLNLKGPAFDLSDRGVTGRAVPARARCLRLHRARRLSLRRDRARHGAAARRAGRGRAERAADARGRAAGRRRIPPRRGARSGRRRPRARRADQLGRLDRHLARARLHRSEAPGGRRDHASWSRTMCPTGWSSISPRRPARSPADAPAKLDGRRPLSLRRAGLRARSRRRDGDRRRPRSGRASPATSSASPTRRSRPTRQPLEDLPQTDDKGKASFEVDARQAAGHVASARSAR